MVLPKSTIPLGNTSLAKSPQSKESVLSEREEKKVMGKRVRFSQPLEYWKDFNEDTVALPELKTKARKDTSIKHKPLEPNTALNNGNIKRTRGKVVRSITDAVQAFQIEDEKTSVRKFIAHYKRTTVHIPDRSPNRKVHNVIVSEFEKTNSNVSNSKLESKNKLCTLCNSLPVGQTFRNNEVYTLVREPSQSSYLLPSNSQRKTFDERLLPFSAHTHNCEYLKYLRTSYTGIPTNQPTPMIVQLFE